MKLLVVGSGGREHALVWKLAKSKRIQKIYCAPGNAGMLTQGECVAIAATDLNGLLSFAKKNRVDLTLVGPEAPLAAGIVDLFQEHGLRIFGPTQAAARLESSKIFTKEFCVRYQIPTAPYRVFETASAANDYLKEACFPLVLKADGLAAGKGVTVAHDLKEAMEVVDQMFVQKIFGPAGQRFLVEEFLEGMEVSFMALVDGKNVLALSSARDHKRLLDGGKGPNTGGMGAFSPADVSSALYEKVMERIMKPTVTGMMEEGSPFVGVLYAGLMVCNGEPKLLEFNVRFGDPEAQVILPRLKTDLVDLMEETLAGNLDRVLLSWETKAAACVVMASEGYPEEYEKGFAIQGLNAVKVLPDVFVFHAGTKLQKGGVVTDGGRVLAVSALGEDLKEALRNAYEGVSKISWRGCYYRRDIGKGLQ